MSPAAGHRALVVDDDPVSRMVLAHMLRRAGWNVDESDDIHPAATKASTTVFDVVFSDFHMPGGTGLDLLQLLDPMPLRPLFVLVTGVVEHSLAVATMTDSVDVYLTKPISTRTLTRCLEELELPLSLR